mmetsp:Transcript_32821/g.105210  ORF Transcript_32821/g.105210 Transcript_32821/m.105210 type:complete len:305 (+) Transcript_32821:634-1548(+)
MEANQQDVEEHAERPEVDLKAIRLLRQLLRRPVRPSAYPPSALHLLPRLVQRHGGAKINQLDRRVALLALEDDVLGLEVAVQDAARMQVVDREGDLLDDLGGDLLRVRALRHQALEQASAAGELHHYRRLDRAAVGRPPLGPDPVHAQQLDDVRVRAAAAHRLHLDLDHGARELLERDELHRDLPPALRVARQPHVAEPALPNPLLKRVDRLELAAGERRLGNATAATATAATAIHSVRADHWCCPCCPQRRAVGADGRDQRRRGTAQARQLVQPRRGAVRFCDLCSIVCTSRSRAVLSTFSKI